MQNDSSFLFFFVMLKYKRKAFFLNRTEIWLDCGVMKIDWAFRIEIQSEQIFFFVIICLIRIFKNVVVFF